MIFFKKLFWLSIMLVALIVGFQWFIQHVFTVDGDDIKVIPWYVGIVALAVGGYASREAVSLLKLEKKDREKQLNHLRNNDL